MDSDSQSFVLTVDMPLQGAFINGDKVAILTCEPDPPVDRLNVPKERALGPGNEGALLTCISILEGAPYFASRFFCR